MDGKRAWLMLEGGSRLGGGQSVGEVTRRLGRLVGNRPHQRLLRGLDQHNLARVRTTDCSGGGSKGAPSVDAWTSALRAADQRRGRSYVVHLDAGAGHEDAVGRDPERIEVHVDDLWQILNERAHGE